MADSPNFKGEAFFDASDFVTAMSQMVDSLRKGQKAIDDINKITENYNTKGKVHTRTIRGITEEGDRYVETLKRIKDKEVSVSRSIDITNRQLAERKKLLQEAQSAFGQKAVGPLKSAVTLGTATKFDTKTAAELSAAFIKLEAAAGKAKISASRILDIYDNLQNGVVGSYTQSEAAVASSLQRIINLETQHTEKLRQEEQKRRDNKAKMFRAELAARTALEEKLRLENLKRQRDAAAITSATTLRGSLGSLKGSKPEDIAKLNVAFAGLENKLAKAGVTGIRLVQIYKSLGSNVNLSLTQAERAVVPALNNIRNAHHEALNGVQRFTDGFTLSWRSIGRLVAIQTLHRTVSEITQLFLQGNRQAIEFAANISLIRTLTLNAARSQQEWGESIQKISNLYGTELLDTSNAYYEALSNQITNSIQETEQFVDVTLRLAAVTKSTAKDSGAILAGVLNSFNLNAAQAERVAAILFKVVDLGSLTLSDISEQIGRAGTLSKTLGISFEELAAFLATFTIEGRKADAALTDFRNLALKLIKPTDEMKKLLKEWGFESGQAAIRTLGLIGVVRKFRDILQGQGLTALSKYFNEIRALQGAISATGTSFDKIISAYDQITKAQEDFVKASDIVFDAPLKKLEIEFVRIKNVFIDLSTTFLLELSKINDSVGGLAKQLKGLISDLSSGAIVSTISTIVEITKFVFGAEQAFTFWRKVIVDTTQALILLKTATALFGGIAGKIITGVIVAYTNFNRLLNSNLEIQKEFIDTFDREIATRIKSTNALISAKFDNNFAQFGTIIEKIKGTILLYLQQLEVAYTKEYELLKENGKDIESLFESTLRARVDKFKDYLNEITRQIKDKQSEILRNEKTIADLQRERDKGQFDFANQFRNDTQKFAAIVSRVNKLRNDINLTGDRDDALGIKQDALSLIQEANSLFSKDKNGRFSASSRAKLNQLEKLRLSILDATQQKLEQMNQTREREIQLLEQQKRIDETRLVNMKIVLKEALKFKLFDAQGNPEFKDPQTAINKANEIVNKLDKLITDSPTITNVSEILDIRKTLLDDIDENGQSIKLQDELTKKITELFDKQKSAQQTIDPNIKAALEKFGISGDNIGQLRGSAENFFVELKNKFNSLYSTAKQNRLNANEEFLKLSGAEGQLRLILENLIPVLRTRTNPLDGTIHTITLKESRNEIEAIFKRLIVGKEDPNYFLKKLEEIDPTLFKNNEQQINALVEQFNKYNETVKNRADSDKALNDFLKQLGELGKLEENVLSISDTFDLKGDEIIDAINNSSKDIIDAINGSKGFARGGFVDSVNARLTPGEYVINRQATALYRHQLDRMNNNLPPGDTLNMGGLTVNVQGGNSPQATAKVIVDEIRRGIRRGIFTLETANA